MNDVVFYFISGIPKVKVRVEFATRLFGTCLDMCPEKERYMRQYQRQLTSFEIDHNSQVCNKFTPPYLSLIE